MVYSSYTLFGRQAVHTLDGDAHRHRKAMLVDVLHRQGPAELVDAAVSRWDAAARRWQDSGARISLHRASAEVLFEAVCEWLGRLVDPRELTARTASMIAMVDGFVPSGPRHLKARMARRRAERWIEALVSRSRDADGEFSPRWRAVVDHRDRQGALLPPHVAAVEILNIVRPATAVSWFVAFGGHALSQWPQNRGPMGDRAFATAFAHELRRFYPFVPFLGALAQLGQELADVQIVEGDLALLDVYGQLHDDEWWDRPGDFAPGRFLEGHVDPYTLIPQGGGDVSAGHRCPGEDITVALLTALIPRLASLRYDVVAGTGPISLRRVPALPRGGLVVENVRLPRGEA